MIQRLFLLLLMLPMFAHAQDFTKGMQQLTVFENKATISVPERYTQNDGLGLVISDDRTKPPAYNTSYTDTKGMHTLHYTLSREKQTEQQLREKYDALKSTYNEEYLDVLKDEFVSAGDNSYFHLEYKLKAKFYKVEKGLEMADGSIYPCHFVYDVKMKKGYPASLTVSYFGVAENIQSTRELNGRIIAGYKVL